MSSPIHRTPPISGRRLVPVLVAAITVMVAACVVLLVYNMRRSSGAEVISIAVLPFADSSAKHDQGWFCDGITEELIDRLGLVPRLRIPAHTSVFQLRNAKPEEIARQLHSDILLQGDIRREGGRLHVSAELVRVGDPTHLWSQTYDEPDSAVMAIEERIAQAVVDRFKAGKLRPPTSTPDPEAHDLFLHGNFPKASAKDSRYAAPHVRLAENYAREDATAAEAKIEALKALELNDSSGQAHGELARALMREWDLTGAAIELKRAVDLSPQVPELYILDAQRLAYQGKTTEALQRIGKALDLDPLSPRALNANARLILLAHEYRQAEEVARKALAVQPDFGEARDTLGRALIFEGRFDEGLVTLKDLPEYGWACARAGRREEAQRALGGSAMRRAQIYAALGDDDHAFESLDRALRNHEMLPDLVEPEWDNLRGDPRFAELLHKAGL